MYNIIYETSHQSRLDARYWMLGAGALGRPRGMVWGGRREEGSGWGTRIYLWCIHVNIWQKQYNIVKLKKKIKFKKMWVKLPQPWGISLICLKVKVKAALSRARHFASQWPVHGILQDRIPEWVAYLFSRGSPQLRDQTQVFHIAGGFFTSLATREAQEYWNG